MRRFPLILLMCCFTACANAQYKAKAVVFTNAAPYPEADLLQIAALKPGDSFSKADLEAAAGRLMSTGYFDEVLPAVDGPFKAIDVRFTLKPIAPALLLPVGLENFVWFTAEELAALRTSIPLLALGVPEAGDQTDRVQTALQQMLATKGVAGTVSHDNIVPGSSHSKRAIEYRVESAHIQLIVHLGGVTQDMVPTVKTALAQAQRVAFNEGVAGHNTNDVLLTPYFDAGDLDAKLTNESRTTAAPGDSAPKIDLTATVVSGGPYTVSSIIFADTPLLSASAFARTQKLKAGDLASRKLLYATLDPITHIYRQAAYLDAVVDAEPVLDPALHQVAYTISVLPGEQYRLKSIAVKGLPADLRPDFDRTFPLKTGDLYNETAVAKYLISHPEIKPLAPYTGQFRATADPATHLVELDVQFQTNSITVH